jgi:hypothetical protein
MRRLNVFILAALLSAALAGLAQQNSGQNQPAEPAPAPIRPEAAAKKNPVKPTPQGLSEARKRYGYHYAMCHRKEGDGKGDLAGQMKLDLRDWRDSNSISKYTDSELFYIMPNGRGKMIGGEGDRTSDEMRWNLVNLVRGFGQKSAAEPVKP